MKFFHQGSIKTKLTLIIMLISGIALFLACTTFVITDWISFRNKMTRDLTNLAEIIGTNSTAALEFNDPEAAEEILYGLKGNRHITSARIFRYNGDLLAQYHRDGDPSNHAPPLANGNTHRFSKNHLDLFHDIIFRNEKIGTVHIQSDLSELNSRVKRFLLIIAAVWSMSFLAVLIMTARLQKIISEPILNLANTAKVVSIKKDYSARALKESDDELGFLTERFNEMLSKIQARDDALQSAGSKLENQARKLKKELRERKKFEKALRSSEERFRDLFDNAPDMYIILDSYGIIKDFNKRVLNVLGYTSEELVGNSLNNIVHHEDRYSTEKFMENIKKLGVPPKNIEVRLLNKKSETLWVSKEFSLLKNPAGKLQSIRVICRDITDQKGLREELERARRLETAGRIAGQISHDFNNLLGPLAAYPILIREELDDDHPAHEMLEEMESAAKKIADINQQLLALGRRGHYSMESLDLNSLIENVTAAQALNKKTAFKTRLEADLFRIKGGAAQLTRALTNLILNADEAMQGKGIVTIKTQNVYLDEPLRGYQTIKRGEYVKLDISDSGTGIKPALLQKIFEPFFTTKTMDRKRGSGLGLSVVHGIIEDHKGYITVKSQVGVGTTFSLYFPVTRDPEVDVSEAVEKVEGGDESILIVDDDPIQRRVTSQLLSRLGYEIHVVTNGEQAIDYVRQSPQDLLLLDMVMDGIDGAETYERILEFKPGQKALVLSGYAMTNRVQQALKLGAGGFVTKPISLNALAIAVRNELDKY